MSFMNTPSFSSQEGSGDEPDLYNEFPRVSFLMGSKSSSLDSMHIWEQVLEESEQGRRLYEQFKEYNKTPDPNIPSTYTGAEYLDEEVFPILMRCLEETLGEAINWDVLWYQKSIFNGIDDLAERLWNRNPLYQERIKKWTPITEVPPIKKWLKTHPREPVPLSWMLKDDEAALIIQAFYRGHLVRRRDDVQEVRLFWKALRQENEEREREIREKDRKEMERMVKNAIRDSLPRSELDAILEHEDVCKSAKGFLDKVLELAWEKIKDEEEKWERSMDREHIEPYMQLRRSLFQLDHMTEANYEKYFLSKRDESGDTKSDNTNTK